ncbi:MAG: DUF1523 family protein [Pseudomonadota bacterium]
MFYYIRWSLWAAFWLIVALVLHYNLPQVDKVQITETNPPVQVDLTGWRGFFYGSGNVDRDIPLIYAVKSNGRTMVYRNEDTGFGWPPYFKWDSSTLQGDAAQSGRTNDWYALRHYGWRSEFLSLYPNAISLRPVDGPDARIIPWFNIIFLTVFGAFIWAVTSRVRRFRRDRIDPALAEVGEAMERVGERADYAGNKVGRWFGSK